MFALIKAQLRKYSFKIGIDIVKAKNSNSDRALTLRLIRDSGSNFVVDVGANKGQFAESLLLHLPTRRVFSFEPLHQAHKELTKKARTYENWKVFDPCGLGETSEILKINISENSVSSSLLPMNSSHSSAAPESRYVSEQTISVVRLEDALRNSVEPRDRIYLKIDTQGTEDKVLRGAGTILKNVVAIQCEVSFTELYRGQILAPQIMEYIESLGFSLYGIANGFRDPKSHRLLQADVFYIREI